MATQTIKARVHHNGAAASAAIAYRLATLYLLPLWGVFAMRWMKGQSHL